MFVCLLLFHLSLFVCLIVFTKVSYNMIFSLSGGWPDCLFDHFITECKLCYSTSVNRVNCVNSVNCVINSNSVNCVNVTNVLIFHPHFEVLFGPIGEINAAAVYLNSSQTVFTAMHHTTKPQNILIF